MNIDVKAYGIENAEAMMMFLQQCGAQGTGAVLHGKERADRPGTTNADVIEYLREGVTRKDGDIVQRDLGPTQADADGARTLYVTQVHSRLRTLTAKAGSTPRFAGSAHAGKLAESANSSGLLMGARSVAEKMRRRAEDQLTVHTGSETQARSVEETYARRRSKLFGVPGSVVYRASGQLLRNLAPGNVRLVRGGGLLSSWRTLLGR